MCPWSNSFWTVYHPRPQQGTSAALGGANTKQLDKSFQDCVMLSKILFLLRILVPPAKRNRNQIQIILLYFCFLVFISSMLFWQGYKGYPGPLGHPGDQVSFPTSQQGSFKGLLAVMLVWLWCGQPAPSRAAQHTPGSEHTHRPSINPQWEESALEFLNLISNFYCSATLSLLGGRKTSSPSSPFICLFTLISPGLY